ncbi:hypothetical protein L596_017891 [Steinernema carpocapsae]|uniref:DJ-1/PfpI domain-containing protein n=1 Tax=Steinernema carpocapsae TaxID=34508 RepID=A0A4U5N397_STECR|nr:hypothetical protein L596_017891 [Steinernema carpocapsae]
MPISVFQVFKMPSALVLCSNGTEDLELVITVDVLRRADVKVIVAGDKDQISLMNKVSIVPDAKLADVSGKIFDCVILPGGDRSFAESKLVGDILHSHERAGALIGTICAAPLTLAIHKIAPGATVTAYPFARAILEEAGYKYTENSVEVDGKIVTSRGPGTSFEFALKLVELLVGEGTRTEIAHAMLFEK